MRAFIGRWLANLAIFSVVGCSSSSVNRSGEPPDAAASSDAAADAPTPAEVCFACAGPLFQAGGACQQPITACKNDAECDAWNTCYETCFKTNPAPSCFAGCKTAHPAAATLDSAVIRCVCDSCLAPCNVACQ